MDVLAPLLAQVFAPDSLASDIGSKRKNDEELLTKLKPNLDTVRPGDIILVRTPGVLYALLRLLVRTPFDHIAVVVENGKVLHVGPSRTRLLPTIRLLTPQRSPMVLRPKLSPKALRKLVKECEGLVGRRYDIIRVYTLIFRLILRQWLPMDSADFQASSLIGRQTPLFDSANAAGDKDHKQPRVRPRASRTTLPDAATMARDFSTFDGEHGDGADDGDMNWYQASDGSGETHPGEWICTDAILWSLSNISSEFRDAIRTVGLDLHSYGSTTINDFLTLLQRRPDLLEKISLPLRRKKSSKKKQPSRSHSTESTRSPHVPSAHASSSSNTRRSALASLSNAHPQSSTSSSSSSANSPFVSQPHDVSSSSFFSHLPLSQDPFSALTEAAKAAANAARPTATQSTSFSGDASRSSRSPLTTQSTSSGLQNTPTRSSETSAEPDSDSASSSRAQSIDGSSGAPSDERIRPPRVRPRVSTPKSPPIVSDAESENNASEESEQDGLSTSADDDFDDEFDNDDDIDFEDDVPFIQHVFSSFEHLVKTAKQVMLDYAPQVRNFLTAALALFRSLPPEIQYLLEFFVLLLFILSPRTVFKNLRRALLMWIFTYVVSDSSLLDAIKSKL